MKRNLIAVHILLAIAALVLVPAASFAQKGKIVRTVVESAAGKSPVNMRSGVSNVGRNLGAGLGGGVRIVQSAGRGVIAAPVTTPTLNTPTFTPTTTIPGTELTNPATETLRATRHSAFDQLEIPFNSISPAVEQRVAQARSDRYGPISWQENHRVLNEPSDKIDNPLYFDEWYLQNERAIMTNTETDVAFRTLKGYVRQGTPDDETYRILEKLYAMELGLQPSGAFMSVTYRGENPALPLAKHFHRVIKIEGIAKPNAQEAFEIEKQLPHVRLIHNSRYVTRIVLEDGVTAQEIDQIVRALTPQGYNIRMSPHEFALQNDFPSQKTMDGYLHLHIEKIQPTGDNDPDISYIVDITATDLVKNKLPHQVFKIYRDLFRQYMDDYMTSYTLPQRGVHYTP